MTRKIILRIESAGPQRRQPLLSKQSSSTTASSSSSSPSTSSRFAELAGGTAAECAAVCCCGPCAAIDLLFLTVVKVPACLCKRALQRKARRRRVGLLQPKLTEEEVDTCVHTCVSAGAWPEKSPSRVVSEMEQEMWATFCNTGFWRSASQRDQ